MDLSRWLDAARQPVIAKFSEIDGASVALWEGGVRLDLHTAQGVVGLKFRTRDEGASFAQTTSTSMAIALEDGVTLEPRVERAIRALVRALDRVDKGQVVVPQLTVEDDEEPEDPRPLATDTTTASPPRDRAQLGLACVSDQLRMLTAWREPTIPVTRLVGRGFTGSRPLADAIAHACEASQDRVIDGRDSDPGTIRQLLDAIDDAPMLYLRAEQVPHLQDIGLTMLTDHPVQGARVVSPSPPQHPAIAIPGDPAPYDELAERFRAHPDLQLAGFPDCVAPELSRADIHASLWGANPDGTVLTDACDLCDHRDRCPGLGREHHQRWGMRGIRPLFDD